MTPERLAAWRVALVGFGANLLLMAVFLAGNDGRVEWFVHFGSERPPTEFAREVLGEDIVVPHADGHDGRFFWLQARDPLLLDDDVLTRELDRPAYRAQRVLYPWLAAPFRALGEFGLIWGMVLVNLAMVLVGGYWATRLAQHVGAPARAGLAFGLNPLTIAAVLLSLADVVALALLVLLVLTVVRARYQLAVGAGLLAVLARESNFSVVAALAVLTPGVGRRSRTLLLAVPLAGVGLWALYTRWRLGWPPAQIEEFAWPPLWGYVDSYRRGWSEFGNWGDMAVAIALFPVGAVVVVRWVQQRGRSALLNAALPFAVMVPFLSAQVVNLAVNSLRVIGPAAVFLAIDLYAGATRPADSPTDSAAKARRDVPGRNREPKS